MNRIEMSKLEKEMVAFDIAALQEEIESMQMCIASATSAEEIRAKVCVIWSRIRKFTKMSENTPVTGKYTSLLSSLLDAICNNV